MNFARTLNPSRLATRYLAATIVMVTMVIMIMMTRLMMIDGVGNGAGHSWRMGTMENGAGGNVEMKMGITGKESVRRGGNAMVTEMTCRTDGLRKMIRRGGSAIIMEMKRRTDGLRFSPRTML